MPLIPVLTSLLARASRALGFETVDAFPPGHAYARTRWDRAYFDIASDLKPDAIERAMCQSIANTPAVFAHIVNPTPRMQRALLSVIDERARRSCGQPGELLKLLVDAYASPHTLEAFPGLRALIEQTQWMDSAERMRHVAAFLRERREADVIESAPNVVPLRLAQPE
ncbi:hypothetical protein NX774_08390 [Massilia agilis]|uniref:Uncharacterized protein n=1 Tax=Massilia agilis TaxID=1811226 RepID=A0ABT2D9H5_9BURK|nr:hypothetical protein [Massilia agilis]MCS0807940.1 hypothetical protein [Massilia agilis]